MFHVYFTTLKNNNDFMVFSLPSLISHSVASLSFSKENSSSVRQIENLLPCQPTFLKWLYTHRETHTFVLTCHSLLRSLPPAFCSQHATEPCQGDGWLQTANSSGPFQSSPHGVSQQSSHLLLTCSSWTALSWVSSCLSSCSFLSLLYTTPPTLTIQPLNITIPQDFVPVFVPSIGISQRRTRILMSKS